MARRKPANGDALPRFLELARALAGNKRWLDSWESLRYAAVVLSATSGSAEAVVREMRAAAALLKERSGWFGPLSDGNRFQVAAQVVREGVDPAVFHDEVQRGRERFRGAKLRRGGFYEVLAILALRAQSPDGRLHASQVTRLASIHAALREDHPWLTGREDYPLVAMLCASTRTADRIREEVEASYRELGRRGFKRSNELQTATHVLQLAPESRTDVLGRFEHIYAAFRDAGLRMGRGDYDEVAALALLSAPPNRIVQTTLRHRDEIRGLKPRPAKQLAFTLATGTTFVDLLRADAPEIGAPSAARLLALQSILQAQQAAILAERRAAAAAAG